MPFRIFSTIFSTTGVVFFTFCFSGLLHAGIPGSQINDVLPPAYDLEKMVVTPSRSVAQNILEIPQSVTSITETQLNSTVRCDLNDAVRSIPGVNAAPVGGMGDSANRNSDYWNSGFTIRGLGAQRVLVLTDGIRQAGQGIGYGGGNLALYDLSSIERVEVLKGPGSVLYGTDAFGGVIQVFSRDPAVRDTFSANVRERFSFDGCRNVGTHGGFIDVGDRNWGVVLNGSYANANLPTLPNGEIAQGGDYRKASGAMKFVLRPTHNSELKILANVLSAHDITIFNDTLPSTGPFYFKIPLYERRMFGAEYSQTDVSECVKSWHMALYNQQLRRKFTHATPQLALAPYSLNTDLVNTDDTVRTTEFQPQIVLDFSPHTLTLGGDFGRDTTYLPEISSLTGYRLKADANQTRVGFYAEDRYQVARKHIFTFGGRYDHFSLDDRLTSSNASPEGLSGSVGYTYRLRPDTSLYATVATGFRSPDLDERYQDTVMQFFTQRVTIRGNPNLASERSHSLDFGIKHQSDFGDLEVSTFYNTVDSFIGTVQVGPATGIGAGRTAILKQRTNIGSVDLFGFETGWKTSADSAWRNYLNLSRTWTDSSANLSLPNFTLGYGIGYQFKNISGAPIGLRSLTPQWLGRVLGGSHDTVNSVRFPAYHIVDTQVAMELATPSSTRTQFVLGMKNIFNSLYSEPFFDQPQSGRGIFTALQVDF